MSTVLSELRQSAKAAIPEAERLEREAATMLADAKLLRSFAQAAGVGKPAAAAKRTTRRKGGKHKKAIGLGAQARGARAVLELPPDEAFTVEMVMKAGGYRAPGTVREVLERWREDGIVRRAGFDGHRVVYETLNRDALSALVTQGNGHVGA